jgi:hypothetical protein
MAFIKEKIIGSILGGDTNCLHDFHYLHDGFDLGTTYDGGFWEEDQYVYECSKCKAWRIDSEVRTWTKDK